MAAVLGQVPYFFVGLHVDFAVFLLGLRFEFKLVVLFGHRNVILGAWWGCSHLMLLHLMLLLHLLLGLSQLWMGDVSEKMRDHGVGCIVGLAAMVGVAAVGLRAVCAQTPLLLVLPRFLVVSVRGPRSHHCCKVRCPLLLSMQGALLANLRWELSWLLGTLDHLTWHDHIVMYIVGRWL